MPLTPWWIITILSQEGEVSNEEFASLLNSQLLQWSLINGMVDKESLLRWWHVDSFPDKSAENVDQLVEQLNDFIYNPLETQKIAGKIDATELRIAIVGDVRNEKTRTYLHCLGRMLRLKVLRVFKDVTIEPITLIYLPPDTDEGEEQNSIANFLTELHTMMEHEVNGERPFKSVTFFQTANKSSSNRGGYSTLNDRQIKELFIQTLFHLMISNQNFFSNGQRRQQTNYFSVGAAAIYYDWRGHQRQLAQTTGCALLERFKASSSSPFVSNDEAQFAVSELSDYLSPVKLFKRLAIESYKSPFTFESRIWEMAKDRAGKSICPWEFYRTALLYCYFFTHLRFLPFRLSEYARLFLSAKLKNFQEYLKSRREVLWHGEGTEKGLKALINKVVKNTLKGEYGKARSLGQINKVLAEIDKICRSINLNSALSEMDDFKRQEVFVVPEEYREYYDLAQDRLEPTEELRLYERLTNSIKIHPIPLALFLRAALISVMFSFLGIRLIEAASPNIVNLEWLMQVPWLAKSSLFLIPWLVALFYYQKLILKEIRKRIRVYIGTVLRHAQTKAREEVQRAMAETFKQVEDYCKQLEEHFQELANNLNYPEIDIHTFVPTTFHHSLLTALDIPGRGNPVKILSEEPDYEISVDGQACYFHKCSEEQKQRLLNRLLDHKAESNDPLLWELLSAAMPDKLVTQPLEDAQKAIRNYAEALYRNVQEKKFMGWILKEESEQRNRVLEQMRSLARPPISFHPGVAVSSTVEFEWKYGDRDRLKELVGEGVREGSNEESIFSLATYQPIQSLNEIAAVSIMSETREASAPARVFTLAMTKLPQAQDLSMRSAIDGAIFIFQASQIVKQNVDSLRKSLEPSSITGTKKPL